MDKRVNIIYCLQFRLMEISMFLKTTLISILSLFTLTCFAAKTDCIILNENANTGIPAKDILGYMNLIGFKQSYAPGMIIGVVSGNDSVLISCGETAIGNGQHPQADTIFAIGSVSKVVTATIFSQMVAEGKVGLTDAVDKYISSSIKVPDYQGRKVTLVDLATHTSGFDRSPDTSDPEDYQNQKSYDEKFAYDWLTKTKLSHKPGSYFLYSNFGFGLLGNALAHAKKTTYSELVKKYIADRLDMKDTTTQDMLTSEQKSREAKSYWLNGDLVKKDWPFDFEQPSGGIYSTGNDLIKFIKYHLQSSPSNQNSSYEANKLNHATYVYQHEVDNPFSFSNDGMALAWHVDFPHQNMPLTLHKNGWVSGFTTWVLFMPTAKVGIFSITNKPNLNVVTDLKSIMGIVINKKTQKK